MLLNGGATGLEQIGLGRELAIALAAQMPRLPDTPAVRPLKSQIMSMLDKCHRGVSRRCPRQAAKGESPRLVAAGHARSRFWAPSCKRPLRTSSATSCLTYALDQEDVPAALAPAHQAVALNPWSSVFHERLAYVLFESQDWDGALREARMRSPSILSAVTRGCLSCNVSFTSETSNEPRPSFLPWSSYTRPIASI